MWGIDMLTCEFSCFSMVSLIVLTIDRHVYSVLCEILGLEYNGWVQICKTLVILV